jgi:hypothetical protein
MNEHCAYCGATNLSFEGAGVNENSLVWQTFDCHACSRYTKFWYENNAQENDPPIKAELVRTGFPCMERTQESELIDPAKTDSDEDVL